MNILSLMPAATELVFALGLGEDLVGVTDECDFPDEVASKPVVSRSLLSPGVRSHPADVDAEVTRIAAAGDPAYALDIDLMRRLEPDVILTQDLCRVCAVPQGDLRAALDKLGLDSRVVSMDPHSLEDVFDSFLAAGEALGEPESAAELVGSLKARVKDVGRITSRLPAFRVLALEWPEPPWIAGHWTPELIEAAGGTNLISTKAKPSVRATWKEVADSTPEIVAFMPCGYYLEEAEEAASELFDNGHFRETSAAVEGNVFAFDASGTFSRPGPRLVDGLEALAWAIHPEAFPEPPPGTVARVGR